MRKTLLIAFLLLTLLASLGCTSSNEKGINQDKDRPKPPEQKGNK